MEINSELYSDITAYCDLNDIKDPAAWINGLLKKAFLIEKYGSAPPITVKPELPVKKDEPTVIEKPIIEEPKEPEKEPEITTKTNKDIYGE